MELAGDFLRACHGGRWFEVSVVRCVPLIVAVDELCLRLYLAIHWIPLILCPYLVVETSSEPSYH